MSDPNLLKALGELGFAVLLLALFCIAFVAPVVKVVAQAREDTRRAKQASRDARRERERGATE